MPVKPESATDEQDEQLLQPNGSLYESVIKKLAMGEFPVSHLQGKSPSAKIYPI